MMGRVSREEMHGEPAGVSQRIGRGMVRLQDLECSVAVFATAIAVLLHFHFLCHAGALWRDEVNSVNLASMPSVFEVWRLTEFDSFPVLWTLLLRGWMHIGLGVTDF